MQYYKYLASENVRDDMATIFDETTVRQEDAKLSYLKGQMEKQKTQNSVYALVDEIQLRKRIDYTFEHIFAAQHKKEQEGTELVVRPRDYACMRSVHKTLDELCDGVMSSEYALKFNKYVIDFCETTPKDEQSAIKNTITEICGPAKTEKTDNNNSLFT